MRSGNLVGFGGRKVDITFALAALYLVYGLSFVGLGVREEPLSPRQYEGGMYA